MFAGGFLEEGLAIAGQAIPFVPGVLVGGGLHDGAVFVFVSIHRGLRSGIEEGEELVIFGVGDRVVFVGVTASAGHGHAEQNGAQGLGAVEIVLALEFSRDGSAFSGGGVHSHEAGCDVLLDGWTGKEVASHLPQNEIVEGKVPVEGAHHPVTIRIDAAFVIEVETVRVPIAHRIEPVAGLMFAVTGALHEFVEVTGVGILPVVGKEGRKDSWFGREAGKSQGRSSGQGGAIGFRGKGHPAFGFFLQLSYNKAIDRVLRIYICGRVSLNRSDKGPVLGVVPSLLHPLGKNLAFVIRKLLFGISGRHGVFLVVDPNDNLTLGGIRGINGM